MLRIRKLLSRTIGMAGALTSSPALAGMPSPLPTHVDRVLRLNGTALERLQVISFFLLAFMLCAGVVMLLWNYVRRDFPALPRATYGGAAAAVFLWGLLFIIVLTMISGARELMTPGAWEKQGFTYKLTSSHTLGSGDDYADRP